MAVLDPAWPSPGAHAELGKVASFTDLVSWANLATAMQWECCFGFFFLLEGYHIPAALL